MTTSPAPQLLRRSWALAALTALTLAGCGSKPSVEARRIEQLELKIQQLETRLNQLAAQQKQPPQTDGKLPAGAIKSLTYRTAADGKRLRIYWADGSQSDLECTQEQATLVCG